jgi:hypothetical protein
VYRDFGPDIENVPMRHSPRGYVRSLGEFNLLIQTEGDPDFETLAAACSALHALALNPALMHKAIVELAYERVRLSVRPDAPSRLDSVFCCCDLVEAFSFRDIRAGALGQVYAGTTVGKAQWAVVDMAEYGVPRSLGGGDAAYYRLIWQQALDKAHGYWIPGASIASAEVLVAGEVQFDGSPLTTLDLLREVGVVS